MAKGKCPKCDKRVALTGANNDKVAEHQRTVEAASGKYKEKCPGTGKTPN